MKYKGFTLAEVLITLSIIGIVAAMTLPQLIHRSRSAQNEAALKKAYSTLEQIMRYIENEEGQKITPNMYSGHKFTTAISKVSKQFSVSGDGGWLVGRGTEADEEGNTIYNFGEYRNFNNKKPVPGNLMDNGQYMLKNGMMLFIENEVVTYLTVDVNGRKKGPNLWGHDLFTFQLMPSGKLLPMGADGTSYTTEDYCSGSSTQQYNGMACTFKALTNKEYWKNLP